MNFVTLGVRSSEEIPWHPGPGCKVGGRRLTKKEIRQLTSRKEMIMLALLSLVSCLCAPDASGKVVVLQGDLSNRICGRNGIIEYSHALVEHARSAILGVRV